MTSSSFSSWLMSFEGDCKSMELSLGAHSRAIASFVKHQCPPPLGPMICTMDLSVVNFTARVETCRGTLPRFVDPSRIIINFSLQHPAL